MNRFKVPKVLNLKSLGFVALGWLILQTYANANHLLNMGANDGDGWIEYKKINRAIGTIRIRANGELSYNNQKSTTLGQNPNLIRILKASLIHLQAMVLGILK